MKKLLVILFLSSASAFAGTGKNKFVPISTSNEGPYGGGGVVCRASNVNTGNGVILPSQSVITSVSVLDLWEAETFKHIPFVRSGDTVELQLRKALQTYQQLNGYVQEEMS